MAKLPVISAEVETISWREAKSMLRAVDRVKLDPAMLSEEGYVKQLTQTVEGVESTYNVVFDRDYVYHQALERIFNPLGLITLEGELNSKYILEKFLPKVEEYVSKFQESNTSDPIIRMAKSASERNGRSLQDNIRAIKALYSGDFPSLEDDEVE